MRCLYLLLLLLTVSFSAIAGNGNITGKVTDEKTGEPIIGASIKVKGAERATMTDVEGVFSLPVVAGTYTVEIKYQDYKTKEIGDVVVTDDNATTVNATLMPLMRNELEGITVRSSAKKENVNALYIQQKNSATISDGISADVIKKSPDRSTGEVLKRVSGTTIQDNKFVIVRGLSDRYNTGMVDNAVLPSTEPNRKAFSFDIIPAALIDNIVITKAATPDLPGDFAGGAINILTKEIPEQNFNTLTLAGHYNTVSTGKKFLSGYRSSTDFLGFDDGARQLPSDIPSTNALQKVNLTPAQSTKYLQQFNNDYAVRERSALPGMGIQGSMGRVYRTGKGRFGFTGAFSYGHQQTIRGGTNTSLLRQYDNFNYKDQAYIYTSSLGGMLNAGYTWGKSKIVLKTLYNRIFDDQFLYREGYNYSTSSNIRYYAYDLIQKSLFKASAEGDHQSGKGKVNWIVAYNIVTNNQPDQRKVAYTQTATGEYAADNTTLGRANNRLFGSLFETVSNGGVNYSIPVKLFSKSSLKAGISAQYRQREFDNRYLGAKLLPGAANEESVRSRPIETLYAPDVIAQGLYSFEDQTVAGDKYDANTMTTAAYAMLDNKLTEKLRVVWGVRAESFQINLEAGKSEVKKSWTDVLPSANFTYALNTKSNLRASYFRSVARPEMREVAGDLFYYDYELNANFLGNYGLQRTQIDNADLRYEVFPGAGEILSASVFYKHFSKPIENQIYGSGSNYDVKPVNYEYARNIGIELEARKNLGFIAPSSFMENLSLYVNVALVASKVPVTGADQYINGYTRNSRPLSGQSPYVVNASLGYAVVPDKLTMNVLYNRIGQRIFLVGQGLRGDVYESPRNLLDFQLSWNMSKSSELRLNVRDIMNAPVQFYFDQDNDKKFGGTDVTATSISTSRDWLLSEYRPGTTFALSWIWKL